MKFSNPKKKFAQVLTAVTGMTAAAMANAGPLADEFTTGVDKTELTAIGGVVLAVSGIIFLIRSARRTA